MAKNLDKYLKQVDSVKRPQKVASFDAELYAPEEGDGVPFLQMHNGYSRFVVTIIDSTGTTVRTPNANIPARDVAFIKKMTDLAIDRLTTGSSTEKSNDLTNSVAYTQKLFDKNYKGKTPAEVLIANPEEKDNLLKVREWLQANASKYKANAAQIKAIDEAIQLLEIGELSADGVGKSDSGVFNIYSSDYKFKTQKNDKGYNLVYSISITCDPSRNYPFTLNITNCYAPVVTESDGTKNIKMAEAVDTFKSSLSMSSAEWYEVADRLDKTLNNFETMMFPQLFNMVQEKSYKYRPKDAEDKK